MNVVLEVGLDWLTTAFMLIHPAVRAVGCASMAACIAWSPAAATASNEVGVSIFEAKCVACHENGGNVLQRSKTLFPSALEANGYGGDAAADAIINLLRNGKGQMPKYQGAIPSVSKLTDEELAEVAEYVVQRSAAEWR